VKPPSVDLVLAVDASRSMGPCFDRLRRHLSDLLSPLQQARFQVRFGLVAYAVGRDRAGPVYDHTFIAGSGAALLRQLYSPQVRADDYFTGDPNVVMRVLAGLTPQGNEDTLLALDTAADFPFGPAESTRRVIAVFSDETLEHGIAGKAPLAQLPALVEKLMQRRIQLFVAAPLSRGLEELASVDGAQVTPVEGGDGLQSVDFGQLLAQIGKSISISSLQSGREPDWRRALFGQDRWGLDRSASEATRRVVLSVGESTQLDASEPLTRINVKLQWTASVDLDLHAFCRTTSGEDEHVFFADPEAPSIRLDVDAGVGDRGGQNEENMTISSLVEIRAILFATKIYSKGGCFADYDGRVTVQTNNGDDITVPLSAQQRADWCVIAKLAVDSSGRTTVTNLNEVMVDEPSVASFER
jgi:uncharacterized protein involved in tellurium resistance